MSIRLRYAVAVAAVGALAALSGAGPAAAAPSQSTTTDPAAAAAGWLAQQFVGADGKAAPTGDHFNFPGGSTYWGGLTASGIFGLAAAKAGADKVASALAYMATQVKGDSNIGNGASPGPYDGSVATAAIAAIVGGGDPTSFGGVDLLQTLKDDECTAVSVPADDDYATPNCPVVGAARNIFSSVSESLTILAEARGASLDAKYGPSDAGVSYFLSLQCANGGFTTNTTACGSGAASLDETSYAITALIALGGHQDAVDKAAGWLVAQRAAAGYWINEGGPNVNSTGLAVAALDAAEQDVAKSRTWLASQQMTDGPTIGTGASRGALKYQGAFNPSNSVKATADGLLGLAPHASLATLSVEGASAAAPVLALAPATAKTPSVAAGDSQTVTAAGLSAGEQVNGVLHSVPIAIGSAKANNAGTVALTFTVPTTLAPGAHTVVLTGATSGLSTSSAAFTVTAIAPVTTAAAGSTPPATSANVAPATPRSQNGVTASNCDSAQLACTGRDGRQTQAQVALGVGLLIIGAVAVYAGRRRRA